MSGSFTEPLDFSALGVKDVANLALQRTGALVEVPRLGRLSYKAWRSGNDLPLLLESLVRRQAIVRYCERLVYDDYQTIAPHVRSMNVERMTDIGCGYGLVDIFFFHDFQCDVQLIDIEESDYRDHNFAEQGAGYSSLTVAKRLLAANGVDPQKVQSCNPTRDPLPTQAVDLVISLLSLGFHYPLETYSNYISTVLKPGGAMVIDVRCAARQNLELLDRFAECGVVKATAKYQRLVLRGFQRFDVSVELAEQQAPERSAQKIT